MYVLHFIDAFYGFVALENAPAQLTAYLEVINWLLI